LTFVQGNVKEKYSRQKQQLMRIDIPDYEYLDEEK